MSARQVALVALAIIIALLLAPRLAGPVTADTAFATIELGVSPDAGGAGQIYVPLTDWGVRLDLFDAPVLLTAEPKALNRDNLLRVAGGDQALITESFEDLRRGVIGLGIKTALVAALLSALLAAAAAALLGWRKKPMVISAVLGSTGIIIFTVLLGLVSYSPEKISEPTFYARGAELNQLINTVDRELNEAPGSYQSNFSALLSGVGQLLARQNSAQAGQRSALVLSDLHSNALALGAVKDFAPPGPLFFLGDFAHQGNDAETQLLVPKITELGRPIFAVSGNHDSAALMTDLAAAGIRVLGQRGVLQQDGSWRPGLAEAQGLTIAGYADPLQWNGAYPDDPQRQFSFGQLPPERYQEESVKLRSWWRGLAEKPDLLLIHQVNLAEDLANYLTKSGYQRRLTILTGHDHQAAITRYPLITIVNPGSVGAGGLLGVGSQPASLAEIRFADNWPQLRAVDLVSLDPFSGQAQAERRIVDNLCTAPCRFQPEAGRIEKLGVLLGPDTGPGRQR